MIPRILESRLRQDARYYPVVTLTGPRQSGKTTLARAAFPDHAYVSLEETDRRRFALEDPRGFLGSLPGPAIIDEAQRAPDLFSYIQVAVDEDPSPGRFILTGSHNFLLMREVSQTLAGRCAVRYLLPFSRAELEGTPQEEPRSPETLFENRGTGLDLWSAIRTGFYPRIHDRQIPAEVWIPDYLQTYLERDVRSLVNLGDLETFERFLALCAGRTGQLLNYSSLASDCGVAVDTARRWISVLKTSFAVFLLRPHHRNFNKRIIKSPKLFFHDTGLACHLLGIREVGQLSTHPARGALFENYVLAEVMKVYLHHGREPPVHFWRDRTGHEVDLVIEEGGTLYPVEIKSGQTVARDMLDGLLWWSRQAGQDPGLGTLVHGGKESYERNGIAVRPWFAV
jgi:predicted AAA+ superfamily ATPase